MRATRLKMKPSGFYTNDLLEIDEVYIEGCTNEGFFKKEVLYDYLKNNPGSIQVNIYPYPNLEPAVSKYNEKYVRSEGNANVQDNLLKLPKE